MSIKKSNKGTTSGVTLKITCKDKVSGIVKCAGSNKKGGKEYSVTRKKIKKDYKASTKDKAGNVKEATVNVTAQKQKRTRTWNSCKTGSSRQCVPGTVKKTCNGYHGIGRYTYTECRPASCSATVACYDPCTYDCSYTDPCYTTKNTCQGGYTSWSDWNNVSSCKKSKTVDCRTVYN